MGITSPDPTISTVDKKLGILISGDLPTCINRLTLGPVYGRRLLTAGTADSPPVFVRHDMLVAF